MRGHAGRTVILLAALAVLPAGGRCLAAAPAAESFGPGKVACQPLYGDHVDCLLSTLRITADNRNEATFDITALPPQQQALFRAQCSHTDDDCTVTVTGKREAPGATRLSTVTAIRWTRRVPLGN